MNSNKLHTRNFKSKYFSLVHFRFIFILLFFSVHFLFSQAPTYVWAKSHATNSEDEASYSVAVDSLNKVIYTCGFFEHANTFTGIASAEMNFGGGNGNRDGYLAKHDFSGNLIWAVNMGSTSDDETYSVQQAIDGNIYITGSYQNTMQFKSIGSPNFTLAASVGNKDVFTASYNSNGKFRWAKRGGGSSGDDFGISITSSGKFVYVMGKYKNAASFGSFSTTALYNTRVNHFIVGYDFSGNEAWLSEAKSNADDITNEVFPNNHSKIICSNDTLFLIGNMVGNNMTFINSNTTSFGTVLANTTGDQCVFYSALNLNGFWIWSQKIQGGSGGSAGANAGFAIAGDCGGLYISGCIHPNATFPSANVVVSGVHDVPFMARCNRATGIDTWRKIWTQTGGKSQHEDVVSTIKSDGKGYIYVIGNFKSSGFFVPDGNLGATSQSEMFVSKYRTDGTFFWVQGIYGNNDNFISDAAISGNKLFLVGQYDDNITFPGLPLTAGFSDDNIFLAMGNLISDPIVYNCCPAPPSIAATSGNQNICSSTTTISANTPIVGSANWYVVEGLNSTGSGTLTNPVNPTNTLTGLSIGTNIFTWVIANKLCNPSIDTIKIKRDASPSISAAGASKTVCINNPTVTMNGNVPVVGTGSWSVISGTATISNPTLATTIVTGIAVGVNVFQWTISSGACAPSTSTMQVMVDQMPSVSVAGSSQTVCANTSSVTLNGNIPAVGTGSWTLITGLGSITTPTLQNTTVTGLGVPSNNFQWAITNGSCPASTSTVTIFVDKVPTVSSAGANQTICISSPSVSMAANTPTSGTGLWTIISGTGSISNSTLETTNVNSIAIGTNVFEWSITSGVCPPSISSMSVIVNQLPSVSNAGTSQTICSSTYTMTGNTPAVGSGSWTVIGGSGTITTPTLATSQITALGLGNNIFQWTISNGVCSSSSSTVSILNNNVPTISNAGASQTLCISNPSTTLNGNAPAVGTGSWTVITGTGTIANPTLATSNITAVGLGNNILEWTISNAPCPASTSTMSIFVDQLPTTSIAGPSQTLCANNPTTTLNGNVPTVGTGLWTVLSGIAS
ncbi:MAG: hypothetical protein Q8T03_11545, partial [Bacteroidota bacterium]|nr:hypothetical protein [Bacteroidota bacterium]